jgi:hypothetical protein
VMEENSYTSTMYTNNNNGIHNTGMGFKDLEPCP